VFQALSNPTRLAILEWLREPDSFPPQDYPAAEVGVCLKHIQARAGVSQSTASQYMAVLQRHEQQGRDLAPLQAQRTAPARTQPLPHQQVTDRIRS